MFIRIWLFFCLCLLHPLREASSEGHNYDDYAEVLKKYVNDQGFVNYKAFKKDRGPLDRFVQQMARLQLADFEKWSNDEKLVFWMNAYNALTLKAILDHYPVKSIKDIGSVFQNVWKKLKFTVMGKTTTFFEIEHEILRKQFNEPRIHMAINCASIGCPPLKNEPFTTENLKAQLDDQTKRFLNNSKQFRLDKTKNTIYLSSILKWFEADFLKRYGARPIFKGHKPAQQAVLYFISSYLEKSQQQELTRANSKIEYLTYNWGLNEQ